MVFVDGSGYHKFYHEDGIYLLTELDSPHSGK